MDLIYKSLTDTKLHHFFSPEHYQLLLSCAIGIKTSSVLSQRNGDALKLIHILCANTSCSLTVFIHQEGRIGFHELIKFLLLDEN